MHKQTAIHNGTLIIFVGLLVILNELYAWIPSWPIFIGILLIIYGFLSMVHEKPANVKSPISVKKAKKRKK